MVGVAALVLLAGLAGCGGSFFDAPIVASDEAESPAEPTSLAPPAADEPDSVTFIEIDVREGVVSPEAGQVDVPLGATVRLAVTSDRDDQIHVNGYDLTFPLVAVFPVMHEFIADVAGTFDVELHIIDLPLCVLNVE